MRVLHTPLNVANDGWSLVQGLRAIGVDADIATIANNPFTNPGTIDLTFSDKNPITRQIAKWKFARKVLPSFDVIHYHAGRSILDYGDGPFSLLDIKAAKKRGQAIAMTYHGCEVRGLHPERCAEYCTDRICEREELFERVRKLEGLVDQFYVTTPDLLSAVPQAKLLPQSVWGIENAPHIPPQITAPLRVVHAPSKRETKGTDRVIEVMEGLIAEGYQFDFRLVENTPHERVLDELKKADIVIDQTVLGWYCVVSVEAASFGKVVVAGVDEEYLNRSQLPAPPFVNATPDTLRDTLIDLYDNPEALPGLGEKAREFVLVRHSAIENARRVLADYETLLERKRSAH